jgi:hypothetical protein
VPGSPVTPTVEEACTRLVDCGVIPLESDGPDWMSCIDNLLGTSAALLDFQLTCIGASTCQDLGEDHCMLFGTMP